MMGMNQVTIVVDDDMIADVEVLDAVKVLLHAMSAAKKRREKEYMDQLGLGPEGGPPFPPRIRPVR